MPLRILQATDTSSLSHFSFSLLCLSKGFIKIHPIFLVICINFHWIFSSSTVSLLKTRSRITCNFQSWMQHGLLQWLLCSVLFSVTFLHFLFLIQVCSQLFHRLSQIRVSCKFNMHAVWSSTHNQNRFCPGYDRNMSNMNLTICKMHLGAGFPFSSKPLMITFSVWFSCCSHTPYI